MEYQPILIVSGTLSICGVVFGIYSYFKNPQINLEKSEGLMAMSIGQLQKDLANLRDNHVHTLDTKLDSTITGMNKLALEVTRLSTIIEERIPKKNNH